MEESMRQNNTDVQRKIGDILNKTISEIKFVINFPRLLQFIYLIVRLKGDCASILIKAVLNFCSRGNTESFDPYPVNKGNGSK